ncbi:MAG: lytic transglycosylase domain-containing protein [Blastocatellia bacterium]
MMNKHSVRGIFRQCGLRSNSLNLVSFGLIITSLGLTLSAPLAVESGIVSLPLPKAIFGSVVEAKSLTESVPVPFPLANSLTATSSTDNVKPLQIRGRMVRIPVGEGFADPAQVRAVIEVESAGNPSATSSKGAHGLMQLMPATAKLMGVDHNDPQQNVEGGSLYLQQQVNGFGDVKLAIAAYNMGPTALRKAMRQAKANTWEELLAADESRTINLPVETKNYVKKVWSRLQA